MQSGRWVEALQSCRVEGGLRHYSHGGLRHYSHAEWGVG